MVRNGRAYDKKTDPERVNKPERIPSYMICKPAEPAIHNIIDERKSNKYRDDKADVEKTIKPPDLRPRSCPKDLSDRDLPEIRVYLYT